MHLMGQLIKFLEPTEFVVGVFLDILKAVGAVDPDMLLMPLVSIDVPWNVTQGMFMLAAFFKSITAAIPKLAENS